MTFFSSVFTTENLSNIPVFNSKSDVLIDKINVSVKDMEDALRTLNVNKSSGPDGLHPRVLKELSTVLSYPLKLLFDKTIAQGKLPSQWKVAEVRPIFKKGNKTSPGNYRPVSLTPIICKIFEKFIKDSIFKHLTVNNLLSDDQYGFCGGPSCTTQLLNTINDWFSYLDNNIPDAVYLYFRKAFDTVPHERLQGWKKCLFPWNRNSGTSDFPLSPGTNYRFFSDFPLRTLHFPGTRFPSSTFFPPLKGY